MSSSCESKTSVANIRGGRFSNSNFVSQKVGSAVLASAKEDVGDGTFSAMLAQSGGDAVDLSIVTSPLSMVLAAAGVMIVLGLLCFVLVRREAKNSPILQLGAKE